MVNTVKTIFIIRDEYPYTRGEENKTTLVPATGLREKKGSVWRCCLFVTYTLCCKIYLISILRFIWFFGLIPKANSSSLM